MAQIQITDMFIINYVGVRKHKYILLKTALKKNSFFSVMIIVLYFFVFVLASNFQIMIYPVITQNFTVVTNKKQSSQVFINVNKTRVMVPVLITY